MRGSLLSRSLFFFIPFWFRQTFSSSKWRVNITLFGKQWSLERKSPHQSSIPLFKTRAAERILINTNLTTKYSFSRSIYPATTITQFYISNTYISYPEVCLTRELHRKVSYLQRRLTNPEYNFIIIQLFLENKLKTNVQRDLFPTTLDTHSVGIQSFLFMFLDFLCIFLTKRTRIWQTPLWSECCH